MVRHEQINPEDTQLLDEGNPHLDQDQSESELLETAQSLMEIKRVDGVYCGTLHRMTETLHELRQELPDLPDGEYDPRLNVLTTYHKGVIYPKGVEEPMTTYGVQLLQFFAELARKHGPDSTVLLVTSGGRMAPARALAQGLTFESEKAMIAWTLDKANAKLGEAWTFDFDPATHAIKETTLRSP